MTYVRTNSPAKPIGRKLQFNIPSLRSNKRHFWGSEEGNYGLLTSQQIEILKQLKRKERDHQSLNHLRPSYDSINKSSVNLNAETKMNRDSENEFLTNGKLNNNSLVDLKVKQSESLRNKKKLFVHKRRQSQSQNTFHQNQDDEPVSSQRAQKKSKGKLIRDLQSRKPFKVPTGSRRLHTIDIERFDNPERTSSRKNHKDHRQGEGSKIIQRRKLRSKIDIHSKSVDVQVRPDSDSSSHRDTIQQKKFKRKLDNQSKGLNIEKDQVYLDSTMRQQKPIQQQLQAQESLYKSKKLLETKVSTRAKFRRDFSPTYCNSFGYPLNCYRYVP